MQNSKPEVVAALGRALDPERVYFAAPDDDVDLPDDSDTGPDNTPPPEPVISYTELNNVPNSDADDEEYNTLEEYVIDVWGESSEEVSPIVAAVDGEMKAIGFRRTHCTDVPKADIYDRYHKNMIYERVI